MAQQQGIEGELKIDPEDPQYELEEHIIFKRTQQIIVKDLKSLFAPNLSGFDLVMDGLTYAFTKLNLANKGVSEINQTICQYPHLRQIDLSFNLLNNVDYIQKLKFVTNLNLSRNLISELKFLAIQDDFTYLRNLNLQGNKIQSLGLVSLKNLVSLNLNNNQIKNLQDFEGHPKLIVLQLRGNKIEKLRGLKKLPNLKQLYLAQNKLTDFEGLQDIPKLLKIHARKNQIAQFASFPDLPSLKYLNLRQNQIRKVDDLKGITGKIQVINVLACPISEQLGDNTKKQIWMKFRNYQKINKSQVGAEEKQEFAKQYKERLAEIQRQRLQKQAAQAAQRAQKQAQQALQKQGKQ